MLEPKNKKQLAQDAFTLASGLSLVRYRNVTYIPADYETRETSVTPDAERTIWLPLSRHWVRRIANDDYSTMFGSDGELSSFEFMVAQSAIQQETAIDSLLVCTEQGLRELDCEGRLVEVTGNFRPNTVVPTLNTDTDEKTRVLEVICEWLNSEEEANSLLNHLATCLAPGWSAVRYILLLGDGNNGKSVLLKMLHALFGRENVSSVSRQAMSEQSPVVLDLNGKLLNVVYDGLATYVKDSGTEKSLVAGEPVSIRKLYESTGTEVRTKALFIEGLNREPKTADKSMALQKRLVRFQFPNVYLQNPRFERSMLTGDALGAFLSLLVDHYVKEDDVDQRLAPTAKAIELKLEQLYANSLGLQFLKYVEETDALGALALLEETTTEVAKRFKSWRLKENDLDTWAEPDAWAQLHPLINTKRKSDRDGSKVRKVRVVTSLKTEATAFIESLKGGEADEALLNAVVED